MRPVKKRREEIREEKTGQDMTRHDRTRRVKKKHQDKGEGGGRTTGRTMCCYRRCDG